MFHYSSLYVLSRQLNALNCEFHDYFGKLTNFTSTLSIDYPIHTFIGLVSRTHLNVRRNRSMSSRSGLRRRDHKVVTACKTPRRHNTDEPIHIFIAMKTQISLINENLQTQVGNAQVWLAVRRQTATTGGIWNVLLYNTAVPFFLNIILYIVYVLLYFTVFFILVLACNWLFSCCQVC
jgi:hypothetical protein